MSGFSVKPVKNYKPVIGKGFSEDLCNAVPIKLFLFLLSDFFFITVPGV